MTIQRAAADEILPSLPTLPALVTSRVHVARTDASAASLTDMGSMWLVDLDEPTRQSRRGALFGQRDICGLDTDTLAAEKRQIVDASGHGEAVQRVIVLVNPKPSEAPVSIAWCLDTAGTILATVLVLSANSDTSYVVAFDGHEASGSLFLDGTDQRVVGSLRSHLSPERIAIGAQLTDVHGRPVMTVSVAGTVAATSSPATSASRKGEHAPGAHPSLAA